MKDSLIIGIKIQYNVAVVHDAAYNFEIDRNGRELRLKVSIVAGMKSIAEVVTEYCYRYIWLHIL